jgi:preprotein translocase SecE subunit
MATATTQRNREGNGVAGSLKDFSSRIRGFYVDVRSEMKKVTRPGWTEVRDTTAVVLVSVAIFGLFFYLVDLFFTHTVDTFFLHLSR